MKKLTFVALLLPLFACFGQNDLEGRYYNHFGDSIILSALSDSSPSYAYTVTIDQYSNMHVGSYKIVKDTLYLNPSFDLNSLRIHYSYRAHKRDSILESKRKQEAGIREKYGWKYTAPVKMLFRDNKLYLITSDGKVDKREFLKGNKKYGNYFTKLQ